MSSHFVHLYPCYFARRHLELILSAEFCILASVMGWIVHSPPTPKKFMLNYKSPATCSMTFLANTLRSIISGEVIRESDGPQAINTMLLLFSCSVKSNSLWPMDCSLPHSSVHGVLRVRILEWVATSFSKGSSQPRDRIHVPCTGRRIPYQWATREAASTP